MKNQKAKDSIQSNLCGRWFDPNIINDDAIKINANFNTEQSNFSLNDTEAENIFHQSISMQFYIELMGQNNRQQSKSRSEQGTNSPHECAINVATMETSVGYIPCEYDFCDFNRRFTVGYQQAVAADILEVTALKDEKSLNMNIEQLWSSPSSNGLNLPLVDTQPYEYDALDGTVIPSAISTSSYDEFNGYQFFEGNGLDIPMLDIKEQVLDVKLLFLYPKVAQKSYGSERRFISPNTKLILLGNGIPSPNELRCHLYLVKSNGDSFSARRPKIFSAESLNISNESKICGSISADLFGEGINRQHALIMEFKKLYINEMDREKYFRMKVEISNSSTNVVICSILSEQIKVLSKPSQLSAEKCSDCSFIAMFNRVKSQTGTTRFLRVAKEQNGLACDPNTYSAFLIWRFDEIQDFINFDNIRANGLFLLLNEKQQSKIIHLRDSLKSSNSPIGYGTKIILQDYETGKITPPFILQNLQEFKSVKKSKTDRFFYTQSSAPDNAKSLSQMHRVALQLDGKPGMYLSVNEEQIQLYETKLSASANIPGNTNNPYMMEEQGELTDKSIWTIVKIDIKNVAVSKNHCSLTLLNEPLDFSHIPIITSVKKTQDSNIHIYGEKFLNSMDVYIGEILCNSNFKSGNEIVVKTPGLSVAIADGTNPFSKQMYLSLNDGLTIKTGIFFNCTF